MKIRIAMLIGIFVSGISCYGAGQSQGYHPVQRSLPEPVVISVNVTEPEGMKMSTVQQDMIRGHIQYAAQQTLKNYKVSISQYG